MSCNLLQPHLVFDGWHEHIVQLELAAGGLTSKLLAGRPQALDVRGRQLDCSLADINAHR